MGPSATPIVACISVTPIGWWCPPPHAIQVASQRHPHISIPLTAISSLGKKKTSQGNFCTAWPYLACHYTQKVYFVSGHHLAQAAIHLMLKSLVIKHQHISSDRPWMSQQLLDHTSCPHKCLDALSPHSHQLNLTVGNLNTQNPDVVAGYLWNLCYTLRSWFLKVAT
jgi:hypothetical protein